MLSEITSQLQTLMASVQSIASTVGQLGGQMQSLQAEVSEMKKTDHEHDDLEEFDELSSELEEGGVAISGIQGSSKKFQFARHTPY